MRIFAVILTCAFLSGCGAHTGTLMYVQDHDVKVEKSGATKPVLVKQFKDSRESAKAGSARIGRLVGGFGETLKSIETDEPLSVAAAEATYDFLRAQGVDASMSGEAQKEGYTITGDIEDFHCAFYFMHNANIKINLALIENGTGKNIWQMPIENHFSGGNIFGKYKSLGNDPTIACFGYDCHARGISAAMNIMFSEALARAWGVGGLKDAVQGASITQ